MPLHFAFNFFSPLAYIFPLDFPDSVSTWKTLINFITPSRISPNLRSTVYCNAIAEGGVTEWDFAWKMYKSATIASEADKLMYALSCTRQPWLLNRSVIKIWAMLLIVFQCFVWSFCTLPYECLSKYGKGLSSPWVCFRYLEYCLDPEMIRKQDAASTIVTIAHNPIGQPLAWNFIRANWDQLYN